MAVTSVIEISGSHSGDAQGEDATFIKASYSARYFVKCSEPTDAPNVVLAHFRATGSLPWAGRPFRLGGHSDVSARCKKVQCDYIPQSGGMYNVLAEFSSSDTPKEQQPDINGRQTENPLLWRDEIEVGYSQLGHPVQLAKFHGFKNARKFNKFLKVGDEVIPMNSALVPYDPGIEGELEIKIIRISKNAAIYFDNQISRLQGTVNANTVNIIKPLYGFAATVPARLGKLRFGGSYAVTNDIGYWKQTAEIHVNPLGWRRELLDRGFTRRAAPGDPDAKGGTMPTPTSILTPGTATTEPILDGDGNPISEPILLDGDGQPLEARYSNKPVWGQWQIYQETSWNLNW